MPQVLIIFGGLIALELMARVIYALSGAAPGIGTWERIRHGLSASWRPYTLYRFQSQAQAMGLSIEELHRTLADANGVETEQVRSLYSGPRAVEQVEYRPFVGFPHRPNQTLPSATVNALGFVGQIASFRKEPGVRRVVILGGSAAFGFGCAGAEHNLTRRLQEQLADRAREQGRDERWEVINLAFVACTSPSELNALLAYVPMLSPDHVIHLSGYNDMYVFLRHQRLYTYSLQQRVVDLVGASPWGRVALALSDVSVTVRALRRVLHKVRPRPRRYQQEDLIYTIW